MSILIRGEEMPKNCVVCKNYYYCELWSKLTVNKRCKERHPDCPIVEVKEPHGRLGDLDKLKAQYVHGKADDEIESAWISNIRRAIANAPTVIEAEGSEE